MKKLLVTMFLVCSISGLFASSIPKSAPIQFDLTAFISMGTYDDDTISDDLDDLELFYKTFRGGFSGILRAEVLPVLSVGTEVGIALNSYDDVTYYVDVPLNIIGRLGFDVMFVEGHVGYYFSNFEELSGISYGVKGALADWFVDMTYIMSEDAYIRYTLGYQISSLL